MMTVGDVRFAPQVVLWDVAHVGGVRSAVNTALGQFAMVLAVAAGLTGKDNVRLFTADEDRGDDRDEEMVEQGPI